MKTLVQFIKESLICEGGASVKNASPIPGNKAGEVAKEILETIKKKFGCDGIPLGSTGKKGEKEMSGDIDVAIQASWDDNEKVIKYIETLDKFTDFGNINKQLHVINFGYEWETDKVVQIDIMFVEDLDFADFAYHSPDFTKNESKYKGMYASALLMAVASSVPVEGVEDNKKPKEGEAGIWWEYYLSQNDGLKMVKKTTIGKNNKPIKPKKIEEKFVTKNVNKIVELILGKGASKEDTHSFEALMLYLTSYSFKHHELYKEIRDKFINDWQLKLKTSKELMKELEDYINEKFDLK